MCKCPRCSFDDVDVSWEPGECPICGLHYEIDSVGEAFSDDEYSIPVWVGHTPLGIEEITDLYYSKFVKSKRAFMLVEAAKHLLLAAKGPEGGPTDWNETRQRWFDHVKELENDV